MNNTPIEGQNEVLVAHWKTTGKDFLSLYRSECPGLPNRYFYRGHGCGGNLGYLVGNDADAIAWMENPGPVYFLKLDRPSLKRVLLTPAVQS